VISSHVFTLLKRAVPGIALALLALVVPMSQVHAQQYPIRPITLIVPWGAGGGTDAVARMLASLLERDLGKPVNVVNRTGGGGVVGHQAVASANPDGYTIGLITTEVTMMHWLGHTKLTPANYTPVALVNTDPAAVQVRADAPYKTLKDLVEDIRAHPSKLKATGCGMGCIWHVAFYGLLRDQKINPANAPWIPDQGAAPGLLSMVSGNTDIVPCSIPEARSLIEAGKVRSLGVMGPARNPIFKDVPTVKEALGSDWELAAWRGIAAPKGLPNPVRDRLVEALKKAYLSKEYKDFMDSRGFGMVWGGPDEFAKLMAKSDADMGMVIKAVGLAR
jgi:tripartite-type tricarboxylate transporter receptor subunit TctC